FLQPRVPGVPGRRLRMADGRERTRRRTDHRRLFRVSSGVIGDALAVFIHERGTAERTYDAIVVGSGISGGWAAKELTEKGLRTLVLERGRDVKHPDYPTAMMESWQVAG